MRDDAARAPELSSPTSAAIWTPSGLRRASADARDSAAEAGLMIEVRLLLW